MCAALDLKVRDGGRVVSLAALVAVGVAGGGERGMPTTPVRRLISLFVTLGHRLASCRRVERSLLAVAPRRPPPDGPSQ
jgi:hypothetical protein